MNGENKSNRYSSLSENEKVIIKQMEYNYCYTLFSSDDRVLDMVDLRNPTEPLSVFIWDYVYVMEVKNVSETTLLINDEILIKFHSADDVLDYIDDVNFMYEMVKRDFKEKYKKTFDVTFGNEIISKAKENNILVKIKDSFDKITANIKEKIKKD